MGSVQCLAGEEGSYLIWHGWGLARSWGSTTAKQLICRPDWIICYLPIHHSAELALGVDLEVRPHSERQVVISCLPTTTHAQLLVLLKSIHPHPSTIFTATTAFHSILQPLSRFPNLKTKPHPRCLEANQVASPALARVPNRESHLF
jgi:hypothetical protein